MTLPLYQNHSAPKERPVHANAGLWYERFFDQFGYQWKVNDEKVDWLKNNFNRSTGQSEQLERFAIQQWKLTKKLKGDGKVFSTQWHFVTGMGNPHPVENGLSWHHILGVPYLTGAAVKGIVRSWLEVWQPQDDEKQQKAKLLEWFGSNSKNPDEEGYQAQAGDLVFFDAFPIEPVLMNVDIMTPHMGKWYEKGGQIKNVSNDHDKVPADWHDPTPIPFISVKKASFLFTFAPRNKATKIDMAEVLEALENALDFMGAGAKTAVGYGQLLGDQKKTDTIIEETEKQSFDAALQNMTEEQQQLAELQKMLDHDKATNSATMGNPTYQRMMSLIKQTDNWEQTDRNKLADIGEEIFSEIGWGKGKKKRERKALLLQLKT